MRLVDPNGRRAGRDNDERQIPKSSYGKIVEIPNHPEISKAVAVEVCEPTAGTYAITVWERSKGAYRIKVNSDRNDGVYYTDFLYPVAQEGRACDYKFVFRPAESDPIRWLDGEGHLLPIHRHPHCIPLEGASVERQSTIDLTS